MLSTTDFTSSLYCFSILMAFLYSFAAVETAISSEFCNSTKLVGRGCGGDTLTSTDGLATFSTACETAADGVSLDGGGGLRDGSGGAEDAGLEEGAFFVGADTARDGVDCLSTAAVK